MVQNNIKEDNLRRSMFGRMHLTAENETIARQYLDMAGEENPALLRQVQHQDLSSPFPMNGSPEYLKWLHKNKRTDELFRYVRLAVEIGGSSAWRILVNDNYGAKLADLENMLTYLTGEHAKAQKMALRAQMCAWTLDRDRNTANIKALCQTGKENPERFIQALDFCHIIDKTAQKDRRHTSMLLAAAYLSYKEAKTAPEVTKQLLKDLLAEIPDITAPAKAFTPGELQSLQNYVRTARKDTPFPQNVLKICSTRLGWMNVTFLATCAFLALRHSVHFEILFRLALAEGFQYKNRIAALDTARAVVADEDFHAKMDEIEEMLPILDEDYIIWCLYGYPSDTKQEEAPLLEYNHAACEAEIRRMAVKCPDGVRAAAQKADSEEYRRLAALVKDANPALYEELYASYEDVFFKKLAWEFVHWHFGHCEETAIQYLLGKCPLDALLPAFEKCEPGQTGSLWPGDYARLNQLKAFKAFSFYRRAVILETLKGAPNYFDMYSVSVEKQEKAKDNSILYDKEQVSGIFDIYTAENVPAGVQLKALGSVCDNVYEKQDRILFLEACAQVAAKRWQKQDQKQWTQGLQDALCQGGVSTCCIALRLLNQCENLEQYKEQLFELAKSCADQVQKQLLELVRQHMEWGDEILALLASKKQKARGFAVMVLEEWSDPAYLQAVRTALEKEKNKKLSEELQALAEELEKAGTQKKQPGQSVRAEEQLAAALCKGSRKRKVEWVQDIPLPAVHFEESNTSVGPKTSCGGCADVSGTPAGQEPASPEYLLAILAAYADMEILGVNNDAARLAAPLNAQELSAYMHALYSGWLQAGAEAKKRWVLYAVALHADAELIEKLHTQIKDWADHSRGQIAAEAVRALALNGSPQALLLVDRMSRRFKSNQIKNAAKKALQEAATALGISGEELEDRIVPDLGFDAQMARVFDYGPRTFTARLNLSLEIEIYDENGKRLKNMPKPGKQDDPEKAAQAQAALKELKKQLKLTVASQKLRLEQALGAARYWQTKQWRELFVKNPIMHQFAEGLIWGTYENGKLQDTFRYMEDGSFNTVDEEEYTLPESCDIGLVHPLELSKDAVAAWKEQLSDYEITQPVEQLARPVYQLTEEEKGAQGITRFYGREQNSLTLSGRLLTQGWVRGEIMDAGFFDSFCRTDSEYGAKLMFSGCCVGYENEDVTIDDLYFFHTLDRALGRTEPCRPDEVSARYFSEILLQIARATGEA